MLTSQRIFNTNQQVAVMSRPSLDHHLVWYTYNTQGDVMRTIDVIRIK